MKHLIVVLAYLITTLTIIQNLTGNWVGYIDQSVGGDAIILNVFND